MAQNFTDDCFAAGHAGLTDLQNMENNFQCLKTLFSGSSAPTDSTAGMPWFDSAKKLLKVRDSTSGSWLGVMYASTAPRFWVYANAAGDGWIVDSSVGDRVISIKGGSNAYNANGGTLQGSWTISGVTIAGAANHVHQWYNEIASAVTSDQTYNSSGTAITLPSGSGKTEADKFIAISRPIVYANEQLSTVTYNYYLGDAYTSTGAAGGSTVVSDATWRPAAANGTLQYLDI